MIKFKKIVHSLEPLFPKLIQTISEQPEVDVLYLYGSRMSGRMSSLSDIDLAVLLLPDIGRSCFLDIQLSLIGKASEALKTDEVDFLILNSAPVQAQYFILKRKKVLFSRNEERRIAFEGEIFQRYLDFKPLLNEYYAFLHQRIKQRATG